jgi:hypothetical protein
MLYILDPGPARDVMTFTNEAAAIAALDRETSIWRRLYRKHSSYVEARSGQSAHWEIINLDTAPIKVWEALRS